MVTFLGLKCYLLVILLLNGNGSTGSLPRYPAICLPVRSLQDEGGGFRGVTSNGVNKEIEDLKENTGTRKKVDKIMSIIMGNADIMKVFLEKLVII